MVAASFYLAIRSFLAATLLVTLSTLRVAFAKTTLAAAIFALMASFFAGGAAANFFLSAKILLAALSCAFKAAFLSGLLALASAAFAAAT